MSKERRKKNKYNFIPLFLILFTGLLVGTMAITPQEYSQVTGWVDFIDEVYNETNRFTVGTTLLNYSMTNFTVRDKELPSDVENYTEWFNGTHILVQTPGTSYNIKFRFNAEPQSVNSYCEAFLDIGEPIGSLNLRAITFPKGQGVQQIGSFTNVEYGLNTWYENGAIMQIICSNDVEFWDIQLYIERLHLGRGDYS